MTEQQLDDWVRSRRIQHQNHADLFAHALADRMRTRLTPGDRTELCATWTAERPVPGVGREHRTVVMIVQTASSSVDRVLADIRSLVRPSDVAIICALGESDLLVAPVRRSLLALLLLHRKGVEQLLWGQEEVDHLLREAILADASDGLLGQLNPYWTQGPTTGRMFAGRAAECGKILSATGRGVAVIGPRGIGKSSLLLFTERNAPDNTVPVYINCEVKKDPSEISCHVMQRVFPKPFAAKMMYALQDMPVHTSQQILLLLDEADALVSHCDKKKEESFYGQLKWFTARGGKLVMAGYRQFRDAVLNPIHSLYQTMGQMPLGPFEAGDVGVRNLIVNPMKDRGLLYWDEAKAVSRIMGWSSGHPLYIQLYCQRLVELCVARRDARIDEPLMDAVEQDERVYHDVLATFNHTTNALEKCVAYTATTQQTEFDETDIYSVLVTRWALAVPFTRVQNACESLILANIFAKRGLSYSFLFNALPKLLRARAPVERLMPYLVQEANRAAAK